MKKQMLEVEKISFGHLQWIYYRQALDGYDSQGNFVQIQHAYFRGEIDFQGLKGQISRSKFQDQYSTS